MALPLHDLLKSLFNASELRRFLRDLPQGGELVNALPEGAGLAELVDEAALAMERRGLVRNELFDRLQEARPNRGEDIDVTRRMVVSGSGSYSVASMGTTTETMDEVMRRLPFLTDGITHLRSLLLDVETTMGRRLLQRCSEQNAEACAFDWGQEIAREGASAEALPLLRNQIDILHESLKAKHANMGKKCQESRTVLALIDGRETIAPVEEGSMSNPSHGGREP